jgi:hypothetical protein
VWREYRTSLPLRDRTSPTLFEQAEESRSWTLNNELSPRGKPVFISYFPPTFYFVHQACLNFKLVFTISLVSKQNIEK